MKKMALLVLLMTTAALLVGATYVVHNFTTGVMHESENIYNSDGQTVQFHLDSIETYIATKDWVSGTVTVALGDYYTKHNSDATLEARISTLKGADSSWTGANTFTEQIIGTVSVALYAPTAGTAATASTAGSSTTADSIVGNAYINKIIAGSNVTVVTGADTREVTVSSTVDTGDFVLQSVKAYINKLVAGPGITLTPGADSREVTVSADTSDTVTKSGKEYIIKVIAGSGVSVTPGTDSREVTIASTGDTSDFITKSGKLYLNKLIAGDGITVTPGSDTREVTVASSATGTIARVYANTDGAYSDGPNISLKQGSNVTITRSGDTFEIAASAGSTVYSGTGTFNSSTGVSCSIGATLGASTYKVSITCTADPAGNLGEVWVADKAADHFHVYCSGSTTSCTFDWILVP